MEVEKRRSIGYLCPSCRKKVIQERSAFALAASGAVVGCACGQSSLTIDAEEQGFRVSVPCGACGGEHSAVIDAERMRGERGIGLACPQTKQLCCFIGEDWEVERELERLSLAVEKQQSDGLFADSLIMQEVLSEIGEIAARPHGISCACGGEEYSMEVRPTYVDLICARCGARLRVDAATDEDLDRLCCQWTLTIKGT